MELAAPWRLPFDLAWEAFRAGSRPVGAVLVSPAGEVVATGRNRVDEPVAPQGQLAGSMLAHAELNTLAQLPAGTDYADHRLYTTLEPCLLCTSALRHVHVGTVFYASADPPWAGLSAVPGADPHVARHWTRRVGPAPGPLAVFGALLMDLWRTVGSAPERYDCGYRALAARCAGIDGLLTAPTAGEAYRLLLPHLDQG